MKKDITYLQYTMAQNTHCSSKREERGQSEEILDESKMKIPEGQTLNSPSLCLMSRCFSGLQFLTAPYFSFRLILQLLYSFPWQVVHNSGISNILWTPRQYKFHLHSFTIKPVGTFMLGQPRYTSGLNSSS